MKSDKSKIEDILRGADEECESANFHDRYGMAESMFDALKGIVPSKKHVKLAEILSEEIQRGM